MAAAQNRIALVTGAGRGLGLACARALLDAGNRVTATDMEVPSLDLFPEKARTRVLCAALNVTDTAGAAALFKKVRESWGPLGILVNNAGVSPKKQNGSSRKLMEVTRDEWDQVMAVNLTAVLELSRLAVTHMRENGWGRIINMASLAGRARTRVVGPTYAASKAAVIGLTRCMANEFGPWGITANAIAPGRILSDMVLLSGEEVNRACAEAIPLKRLGIPEEVGAVAAFLASEGASFVNGTIIDVNGGSFMP
jgi:3-oxoacyl-[acyl-carrier protein] reductase